MFWNHTFSSLASKCCRFLICGGNGGRMVIVVGGYRDGRIVLVMAEWWIVWWENI